MKLNAIALFLAAWACLVASAQSTVTCMSFNIRLDVKADGENQWGNRKEKVAGLMNYYEPDFIGGQEVQHHQLEYLRGQLKNYRHVGVGRDDGREAGEYSCIFYRHDRYTVLEQGTFWLSSTPEVVSRGWDAACNRVCTYGLFRSIATKRKFWVFNTHFDHQGATARMESAKLLLARIQSLTQRKDHPVIVLGDLNSKPGDEPVRLLSGGLDPARSISLQAPYGPADTWNGFKFNQKPDGCIDYIFVSRGKGIRVLKYATLTDSYDLKYPSDHFPIMATLQF